MNPHLETTHMQGGQGIDSNRRRFATPLRRAFKCLKVTRKKDISGGVPSSAQSPPVTLSHNTHPGLEGVAELANPPAAPRPARWASPMDPPSPISPLLTTASRSSNMLTVRSRMLGTSCSRGSIQGPNDDSSSSSSPIAPMPRGDLFQLGLTPVQSRRSLHSETSHVMNGGPRFAPSLLVAQRVSAMNVERQTAEVDMVNIVETDVDTNFDGAVQTTPTPSSRITWLPSLSIERNAVHNPSTIAVFEGGHPTERRRTSFMSKLVGSAWGLAGIGFHGQRRAQSMAAIPEPISSTPASLPSIPLGKGSIEQAVLGPMATRSRLSTISNVCQRDSMVDRLPPANSTMRMTGSKSGRALDHLDDQENHYGGPSSVQVKVEERPKKKRRGSGNNNSVCSSVLGPTSTRVTRAMAARQAEAEVTTPARVTRSASKRIAELGDTPTRNVYDGAARQPKSLK